MFYVRGLFPNEASLVEVECKIQNLRSRTSYLFINPLSHLIYIWNGSKCLNHMREVMQTAVENLINSKSAEIGLNSDVSHQMKQLEEGKEVKEFWNIFQIEETYETKDLRNLYFSLLDSHFTYDYTPRLFHLSSSSGEFKPKEILCSFRSRERTNPYPFLQEDLYSAQQPTFFLLDDKSQIFLWESKFPFFSQPGVELEANSLTGSANIRWNVERKYALDFALAYSSGIQLSPICINCFKTLSFSQKQSKSCQRYGCLRRTRTQLIPSLISRVEAQRRRCAHPYGGTQCLNVGKRFQRSFILFAKDGRKSGDMTPVVDILSRLREPGSVQYSIDELRKRPEGVNPLCLESYLSDEEFKVKLLMKDQQRVGMTQCLLRLLCRSR